MVPSHGFINLKELDISFFRRNVPPHSHLHENEQLPPENQRLEDDISFWDPPYFQGYVSFRECILLVLDWMT